MKPHAFQVGAVLMDELSLTMILSLHEISLIERARRKIQLTLSVHLSFSYLSFVGWAIWESNLCGIIWQASRFKILFNFCTIWKNCSSSTLHHFIEEAALKDWAILIVDWASPAFLALRPFTSVYLSCFQVFQLPESVPFPLMPLTAVDLFSRGRYMPAVPLRFPLVEVPLINWAAMLFDGHTYTLWQHLFVIPSPRIKCLVGHYLQTLVLHLTNVIW